MPTEEGKLYLFVAVDRTSKFAFAELHERVTQVVAADFLRYLIAAVPYKIHTLLTDNGIQFANRPNDRYAFPLLFDRLCAKHGIEPRLTQPNHPWANGQVERMYRTSKEATVYRYFYDTHQQLRERLTTSLDGAQVRQATEDAEGIHTLLKPSVRNGDSNPNALYPIRPISFRD